MEKKVAIILLNWNSYEHTANCIESLSAVRPANFDILVVDNGSTDGSGTALQNKFNNGEINYADWVDDRSDALT